MVGKDGWFAEDGERQTWVLQHPRLIGVQEPLQPRSNASFLWSGDTRIDPFRQGPDQPVPIAKVVVDGHRIDPRPLGQATHGKRFGAIAVENLKCRRKHRLGRDTYLIAGWSSALPYGHAFSR